MIILIAFAFLAGIITVLSPCILPVLPIILTSSIGGVNSGKSRPLGVITGFIFSFTFFTLFLATIVKLLDIPADTLRLVSVFVVAIFGLSLLIPRIQLLLEKSFSKVSGLIPNNHIKTGFNGGLIIGISVGLLWTPCVGPILASVITLAITGTVTLDTLLITLAYSMGTAIPMFLIMLGGIHALKRIPWLLSNLVNVQKIFGILMILTAIGLFFNIDRKFQTFILNAFPQYGAGLTKIEDNDVVKEQLDKNTTNNLTNNAKSKYKKAPDIIPGGIWFNSEPITLSDLKGKVVIIDFWTYSCINCQRTLPYLREWNEKYKDKGLVIIGVHSPEFGFERDSNNVLQAIKDFKLSYPVVQDNNFATWKAYNNRYWPAKYFIDKDGYIRYTHFGEGDYDESERIIQELLKETGAEDISTKINNPEYQISAKTPEIYLGYGRLTYLANSSQIKKDNMAFYSAPGELGNNQIAYEGNWLVMEEYANPQKDAILELNFDAKEVYLVMRSKEKDSKIEVYLDNKMEYFGEDNVNGTVTINSDRLYKLIKLQTPGRHMLKIIFKDSNVEAFAFTFY